MTLFALQMPIIYFLKREPYPALTMPSFAGHPDSDGLIEVRSGSARVIFGDGSTEEIDLKQILPTTKVRTGHVLRAFEDPAFLAQPATVGWLKSRLDELHPSRQVVGADIIWRVLSYDVFETSLQPTNFTVDDVIRVDFKDPK